MTNTQILAQESLKKFKSNSYRSALVLMLNELFEEHKDIIVYRKDIMSRLPDVSRSLHNIIDDFNKFMDNNKEEFDKKIIINYCPDEPLNYIGDFFIAFEYSISSKICPEVIRKSGVTPMLSSRRIQDKADSWRNGEKLLMQFSSTIYPPHIFEFKSIAELVEMYRKKYVNAFKAQIKYLETGEII